MGGKEDCWKKGEMKNGIKEQRAWRQGRKEGKQKSADNRMVKGERVERESRIVKDNREAIDSSWTRRWLVPQ